MEQAHSARWLRRVWRYGPVIVWIALISFASTDTFSSDNTAAVINPFVARLFPGLSADTIDNIHVLIRKSAHVTEYAIFALLMARAFLSSTRPWLRRHWFLWALLLVALMGLADEYHQSFVPGRTASIRDSLIDFCGGLAALALLAWWRRRRVPAEA